jgi:glycosyltransferase involved in cell wall biosynthesis
MSIQGELPDRKESREMMGDPALHAGDDQTRTPISRKRGRLRVLQVIDSLTLGGAEQLLVTLARHIDAARYDLRVCSLAPLDETGSVVRDLRALDIPLYAIGDGGTRRHSPVHVIQLAGLVRKQGIAVLHTHLGYGNTIGALAGTLAGRPVVSTLHNAHLAPTWSGRMKQGVRSQVLRWCARTIIACAPEVREAGIARLHLPASKVIDVPNGIDTEAYARADPVTTAACRASLLGGSNGPIVLAVGNLRPAKGHEYLLDAAVRVRERFPGLRVVIAGRGGAHEAPLRARVAALGLEEQVILTGERRDVAPLLHAADLFVQPSIFEGLPLALLEAMAAGVPTVGAAVGGIPRVVEDRVTGRLVPAADPQALAEAMLDLLTCPEQARNVAVAARLRVQRVYGANAWARRLQSVYDAASGFAAGPGLSIVTTE